MSNHKIPKTTGGRIYKLRRERKGEKYSQTDFAKDLNISKQLVQAWESDERPISKTSQIVSVADTLETSTDYLLCRAIDDRKVDDISPADQIGLKSDAVEALKRMASLNSDALNTFIVSDDFSELILNLNLLRVKIDNLPSVAELISRYRNSPGELITDPYDKLRLLRLEIDDCIRHFLESEYSYSSSVKELEHNIELALAALEQEDKSNDGIT